MRVFNRILSGLICFVFLADGSAAQNRFPNPCDNHEYTATQAANRDRVYGAMIPRVERQLAALSNRARDAYSGAWIAARDVDLDRNRHRDTICFAFPKACERREAGDGPAAAGYPTFQAAFAAARKAAEAQIGPDRSMPLPGRAAVLAAIGRDATLAPLPEAPRKALAELALALEAAAQLLELAFRYEANLYVGVCALDLYGAYDDLVSPVPGFGGARDDLEASLDGLAVMRADATRPILVRIPGDPAGSLNFFSQYRRHIEKIGDVADSMRDGLRPLMDAITDTDAEIVADGRLLTPQAVNQFNRIWWLYPLALHATEAREAGRKAARLLATFDDVQALYRTGMTQFPPGGSGLSLGDILRGRMRIDSDITCGESSTASDFEPEFDADGAVTPWLEAQPGLLRGDAIIIAHAVQLCTMRSGWSLALDYFGASFVDETALDGDPDNETLRVETQQHPRRDAATEANGATLKQAFLVKSNLHNGIARGIWDRIQAVNTLVP